MSLVIILFSFALLIGGLGIVFIRKGSEEDLKSISVCIVARNEEDILSQTLASLSEIRYPEDLFEIFLVDDCSTDKTGEMFAAFSREHKNVRCLRIEPESKKLPGKKEGLQRALENSRNDIFLLTDADCIVKPQWLHDCSRYWDKNTKMLVGYAPEDYDLFISGAPFIKKPIFIFRRFSQLASAGIFAATIGWGAPFSCYGRNVGISRKLLLNAGGYHKIGKDQSGDDKQALNLINKQPGKVRYSPRKNVVTFPDLKSYDEQQKRRFGKLKMSSTPYYLLTILIIGFFIYLPFRVIISSDYLSFIIYYLAALLVWLAVLFKHREKFLPLDLINLLIYPYFVIYYTIIGSKGNWIWKS